MSDGETLERVPVSSDSSLPVVAAAAMVAWVALELAFRRGIAAVLAPRLDTGLGADMAVGLVFLPLAAAVVAWLGRRGGIGRGDWAYSRSLRAVAIGLAGAVGILVVRAAVVTFYASVLGLEPSVDASALGIGAAPTWALALLFVVNGFLVPVVEEFAWRGVIQTALTRSYGTAVAVVVTAVAFVLKHVVVDMAAPLFRVTSLAILAVVFCGLRARYGTTSATVAHVGVNALATGGVIVAMA